MEEDRFRGGFTSVGSIEFNERKKYLDYLRASGYNLIDTHNTHKLYGLVNSKYNVIMPNVPELYPFGDYSQDIQGINFVVSQFNKFKDFYNEVIALSSVRPPSLISDLVPTKAYKNFETEYLQHQLTFLNTLLNQVFEKNNNSPLIDSNTFYELFTDSIFSEEMSDFPVTKSGFAISPLCDIFCTGLYVDLGQEYSPHLDQLKVDLIKDPGFECYVEYANAFGFHVDANNPWRMIANPFSAPMKENILNNRSVNIFEDFYSNEYLFKVSLNGGGGGGDFAALKAFYNKAFIEFNMRYNPGAEAAVFYPKTTAFWLGILIKNKLREFGLLNQDISKNPNESEKQNYQTILNNSLDRYRLYGLTSISGAEGYIMEYFSNILKSRMLEG
tara:strand:+ start:21252 stop:22409 length:1158 start_codon:yes stop_codon:yes gene_type:complete